MIKLLIFDLKHLFLYIVYILKLIQYEKIFILSVLLSIVSFTIAQKWDGTTKTPVTPNKNIYTITNGAELAWVAQQCNDGTQDLKVELF